jgi:hypothetical protein
MTSEVAAVMLLAFFTFPGDVTATVLPRQILIKGNPLVRVEVRK